MILYKTFIGVDNNNYIHDLPFHEEDISHANSFTQNIQNALNTNAKDIILLQLQCNLKPTLLKLVLSMR